MAAGRRLWVSVHRWIAFTIGLVLALLGATGSVMVLHEPILRWEVGAAPLTLQSAPAPGTPMADADAWKAAATRAYPQFKNVMGTVPPNTGFLTSANAMVFGMLKDRKGMGIAMLDPYTAVPRGFFVFDDLLLSKVVAFHRFLMLPPPIGSMLIAVCGICLAVSLATGIWLWWPRDFSLARWKKSAMMSWRSKGMKRWLELHNVSAIYLFIPLAVLAVTGIMLAQPGWFAWLGLARGSGSAASSLHGQLMLGRAGEVLIFLTGIALPLLYVSGLVMWWKKRRAQRH